MTDKAFLNGINDYRTIGDLRGCVNDTESVERLLTDEFGFSSNQIRVRTDSEVTKSELRKGWKWLMKDARPGDRRVFHFSGHGSYTADQDAEAGEADRRDELLCLYGMDWYDSSTYLLDDELAEWTREIPEGVFVTFILDCCHSGTGTRMIKPPIELAVRSNALSAASYSIDRVAVRRATVSDAGDQRTRSVGRPSGIQPHDASDIDQATVLARFAPPPPEIEVKIAEGAQTRSMARAIKDAQESETRSDASMNHVLWSGCRDDQTSADAYIGTDFYGAFTYYFCELIGKHGSQVRSNVLASELRTRLKDERFSQVPQLEPKGTRLVIFGGNSSDDGRDQDTGVDSPDDDSGTADDSDNPALIAEIRSLRGAIDELTERLETRGIASDDDFGIRPGGVSVRGDQRSLVYIHGICEHESGYSKDWWDALKPHLREPLRSDLAGNRAEVLWSRHVTDMSRSAVSASVAREERECQAMLEAILAERATREAQDQLQRRVSGRGRGGIEPPQATRALFGIPGLDCVDDFVKYLRRDSVRGAVIAEAANVLRPRLQAGESIELVSHSWGTVVAYEALCRLEDEAEDNPLEGKIHNWFTVGAALAIGYVARQLRPSDGRKPRIVDKWWNLDARGDFVGGSVWATGMRADGEFLDLDPVNCEGRFGWISPACAHSSYFISDNFGTNRDIFAGKIQR